MLLGMSHLTANVLIRITAHEKEEGRGPCKQ